MSVVKRAKIPILVAAAVALALPVLGARVLPAYADQSAQSAAEILQDGLDALSDSQSDLATELFEHVIQSYPGSEESRRAERELRTLGVRLAPSQPVTPDAGSGFVRRTPESEQALRTKFAREAGDRVFFAENSAVIGGRARALIETQARWLTKRSNLRITIVGRADDSAPADASRDLSAKRAEAVRDKLVASGIALSRITLDARGTRDPVATCRSQLCQAQNRHVETVVTMGATSGTPFDDAERGPSSSQKTGQVRAPADDGTVSR